MSSVSLQENVADDLKILYNQSAEVTSTFCKLGTYLLTKGYNALVFNNVSEKFDFKASELKSAVNGLVFLILEACRNELNDESFWQLVVSIGFKEEAAEVLRKEYRTFQDIVQNALPHTSVSYPQYKNLEWRFETQISSRSIRNEIIPRVVMKLDLEKGHKNESICIQSDIPNVLHMSQVLNEALLESRTHHSRKMQRAVT